MVKIHLPNTTDIIILRNNFNTMMDRESAKRNVIPAFAHAAMAMLAKGSKKSRRRRRRRWNNKSGVQARPDTTPQPPKTLGGEEVHVRHGKRKAQEDAVEQTEKERKRSRTDGDKRPESIKQDIQIRKCKRRCPENREGPTSTNKKMKLDTEKESAFTSLKTEKGNLIILNVCWESISLVHK